MADSAPKVAEAELQESPQAIGKKAQLLADQIRTSKHFIAFTGAGVSTSAGIPDFRGPEGAWTLRAQGRERTSMAMSTLQAIPTPTHMALVELQNRGLLKHLVSQNCDGLHRRSGMLPDRISELHGNSNREYCKDCGKEYIRDFRAVATYEKTVHDHRTGRKCVLCNGPLLDTIINFGEPLPEKHIRSAFDSAKKADLCLVLGSSLTVTPANEVPEVVGKKKNARLVICNLQKTPLDSMCSSRIYTKTDDLMIRVMQNLDIPIPSFILHRRLIVELENKSGTRPQLTIYGIDVDSTPVTFLRSVKIEQFRRVAKSEPFIINFRSDIEDGTVLKLELEFMGHYGEQNVDIEYKYREDRERKTLFLLKYDPFNGWWRTRKLDGLYGEEGLKEDREGEEKEVLDVSVIDLT